MKILNWNEIVQSNKIIHDYDNSFFKNGSAVTIGAFDGPHSGHQHLFDAVFDYKNKYQTRCGVVTFSFSPPTKQKSFLSEGAISTLSLKCQYFESKGFDFIVVIDFSDEFSKMKGKDFLLLLKEICSMQFLAAGFDFRCGYNLDTGVAELADFTHEQGVAFSVISEVLYHGNRISSSFIRQCVLNGDFKSVTALLGRPYEVDCSDITWCVSQSFLSQLEVARGSFVQVLPRHGEYPVTVESSSSLQQKDNTICSKIYFQAVLIADFNFLRLEIPPEQKTQSFQKIIFTM